MKYGVLMFPTDYAIPPADLARHVEAHGFESLWFPEHTHIPASRKTPWPGGAPLPQEYWHTIDLFVALGAAAAATTTLNLGSGICLVVERDPITLAKEVASIDFISNGRFLFGVGGGWNVEEMENHGTDYGTRWTLMKERIEAMKEIWTKDDAEYHGKFVNFDAVWSFPKPVQKPHPPVYVGGDGERTLQRVVKYGDAWMPIPGRSEKPLGEKMKDLNALAADAGRGPIPVTVYGALPRPEVINHFAEIGVDRCIFWLSPAQESEVLPQLERYQQIAREVATAGA